MDTFIANKMLDQINTNAYNFYVENGYVILSEFLDQTTVTKIRYVLANLSKLELENNKAHTYGNNLQRIWNLLNKDLIFHEILLYKQLDLWMNAIFNRDTTHQKYYLSSYQANILHPGARKQILHVDTPIPEPIPPFPIKANCIVAIDQFTDNNGATEIIPKSHLNNLKPERNPNSDLENKLIKVLLPSGSLLITNGNLWHRSSDNNSKNSRHALLISFAASYAREIACEDDTVRFLSPNVKKIIDPKIFEIIGGNHGIKNGNDYSLI